MIDFFNAISAGQALPNYDAVSLAIAGQSNARANTFDTDPDQIYQGEMQGVFDGAGGSGWSEVNYGLNGSVDGFLFGIDIPFAYYANQYLFPLGVITNISKRARGSSSFADDNWTAGNDLAADMNVKLNALVSRENSEGYENILRVFFWNQGESDGGNVNYADQFITMLEYYETTLGREFDAVIIANLRREGTLIRDAQQDIINNRMGTRDGYLLDLADNSRYPIGPDDTHFLAEAVENQGKDAFRIIANNYFGLNISQIP